MHVTLYASFCATVPLLRLFSISDRCIDVVKDVYDNVDYNGSTTEAKYWIYRMI